MSRLAETEGVVVATRITPEVPWKLYSKSSCDIVNYARGITASLHLGKAHIFLTNLQYDISSVCMWHFKTIACVRVCVCVCVRVEVCLLQIAGSAWYHLCEAVHFATGVT